MDELWFLVWRFYWRGFYASNYKYIFGIIMTVKEVNDVPLNYPVIDNKTGEELFIIGHSSTDHHNGTMCKTLDGKIIWINPFRLEAVKNSGGKV